jgi:DNA invertase Pin-like site-specific DNA recombinase
LKVAVYARYSSDNQREASIADQLRVCREHAARQGWTVTEEFTDHAVSGATLLRTGFQALMRAALDRRFDVVLAEALDRFSRDQEDTAGLFKRLTFAGVNIVTLAEGDITHFHVGLKGTMNALFLKDLADKTRRGLRGRVKLGKSGGGLCYGYRVARATTECGARAWAQWRRLESEHDSWQPGARHGRAQQRALRRPSRVEPSPLRERSGYWQARFTSEPTVAVGNDQRSGFANRE